MIGGMNWVCAGSGRARIHSQPEPGPTRRDFWPVLRGRCAWVCSGNMKAKTSLCAPRGSGTSV